MRHVGLVAATGIATIFPDNGWLAAIAAACEYRFLCLPLESATVTAFDSSGSLGDNLSRGFRTLCPDVPLHVGRFYHSAASLSTRLQLTVGGFHFRLLTPTT